MRSEEVSNALGEATPSSKQVLAEKNQALEDARGRYALAKEMRDEEEMGIAGGIIDALQVIISSIETELVGTREVEGVRRAKDRLVGIQACVRIGAVEHRCGRATGDGKDCGARGNHRYPE